MGLTFGMGLLCAVHLFERIKESLDQTGDTNDYGGGYGMAKVKAPGRHGL